MEKETAIEKILNYIKNENILQQNKKILNFENIHYIEIEEYSCKVRELTWKEALEIDAKSFHLNKNEMYFNSESEKRQILNKALLSIIEQNDIEIQFSIDTLKYSFVEKLWNEYQKYLHLSSDEINLIYNSTKKYFNNSNNEIYPIHPMIIEVDYIIKGIVSYSKDEFKNLTLREFEALQLILSIKNSL